MADLESSAPAGDGDALAAIEGYEATLQHIRLLQQKRDDLMIKQREAEEQHLHRLRTAFYAQEIDMDDLADAYKEYQAVTTLSGYTNRWDGNVGVSHARLAYRAKGLNRPNGPHGSWQGSYPLISRASSPPDHTCLVYVLFDADNQPCYVGSTQHFRLRLRQHRADGKEFTYWHAYPCDDRAAAYALEDRLLKEHKPYLNKRAAA